MKNLKYVLLLIIGLAMASCTEDNIKPKGDDDLIGIPPPPPPPPPHP